jgi:hypothetical protein
MENPDNQVSNRNEDGTFRKGFSGNLKGRPAGKSMKEWIREKLSHMTEEERNEYVKGMNKVDVLKFGEGMPQQDITSGGDKIIPTPLLDGLYNNNRNTENSKPNQETTGNPGGNVGG